MAIKVIYKGTPPGEREFKGICIVCHTRIECLAQDGELTHGSQREPGDIVTIPCPVCSSNISAYEKKPTLGFPYDR